VQPKSVPRTRRNTIFGSGSMCWVAVTAMLPSWVPRVTNGDHTTLRGAGGQRVRRTKLYTHTGRREHDGPTVVGTTCRPVTVSHVVPTYSTYVTHSRHLHTTVRVSYLRPTSYGVARVPLDTLLPTRRVGYVRIFQHFGGLATPSVTLSIASRRRRWPALNWGGQIWEKDKNSTM